MENQSFKTQLKQIVKEYLDIDNEIATLQKALKERKDKGKPKEVLLAVSFWLCSLISGST